MKRQSIWNDFITILLILWLAACSSPSTPVDSIANEPYYQDSALLDAAWQLPVAQHYKGPFEYQINEAFCGPATVTNLLHSIDRPGFTQSNLFDHSKVSYWKVRTMGITLDEMADLIRDNAAAEITVLRDLTLAEFRAELEHANDPQFRYLINFNRRPLFGVSIGHHSPIGGYLKANDLVFVLDVLDQYRPFLVPTARLYEAMDIVDAETGKKRGLLRIGPLVDNAPKTLGSG